MRRFFWLFALILLLSMLPSAALADCPTQYVADPSFEDGKYKGETVGTSLSSWLAVGWLPWAILGDQQINREIEFFVVDGAQLQEGYYRVHSGRYAQKFFSGFSTHHAGFYQRIPVTPGSRVTFTIWAQIATGQESNTSNDLPISDLKNPGNYRVWAGIDPYGDAPAGFGAPPSQNTVWSQPVLDRETRQRDDQGHEYDAWVQLSVSTYAQRDHITVYTKGQPEFPVKNNSSFWDDACLIVEAPPTNTPVPTPIPSETPVPTETPLPTDTPMPTATATETPLPSATPLPPTDTPQPVATDTPIPVAEEPTEVAPTPDPPPTPTATLAAGDPEHETSNGENPGLVFIYTGVGLLLLVVVVAILLKITGHSR